MSTRSTAVTHLASTRIGLTLTLIAILLATPLDAQVSGISGVPGDGIPDFYYFPGQNGDSTVTTSLGEVTRSAGAMILDTDGTDFVFGTISGPEPNCALCDGMNMPGIDSLANVSTWTYGYANGAATWERISPSGVAGFRGVAVQWYIDGNDNVNWWQDGCGAPPFLDCPEEVIATYPAQLVVADFERVFVDGSGERWNAVFANSAGEQFFTNVTMVPEHTGLTSVLGILLWLGLARLPTKAVASVAGNALSTLPKPRMMDSHK